jgi:hypothetical protein
MKRQLVIFAILLPTLLGCSKFSASDYVGVWNNEYAGGSCEFIIVEDGAHFLIKQIYTKTGVVMATYVGQVEDGYLMVSVPGLGKKAFYSETEDAIIFEEPAPPFKRKPPKDRRPG